ncbi:retrovirus-related Pol polyprotein from transposon 17.6 [Trichonephila clavipes]|nr:retrovirus-related Pol polyprotein from transposon 17.6 [Trichonephila clavipes]
MDFYHELNTYFNGWIDGLKIDIFDKLSDLIITDQLKRKTPFEFKEYYLDEWANMNFPVQLAEKLEEFEDFKRTLKQKSSSPFVKKQEFKFTEKIRRYEAPGKFEYNRKDKKFPALTNYNKKLRSSCHQVRICSKISRQRAERVKIKALVDSGSTVSLLRENTSRRIMDPTKLSKNKILLTGVKFNKYENRAQLIQISAENLQEEVDLRHGENRQIKKELEKLIQDYKPEKTASTDITMLIILKDEEPVCQPLID